jgi:hypothetical protein
MFEKVQFFRICNYSLQNVLLSPKNINMGKTNAEFYADFEFVDAGFRNCPFKN